MNSKDSKDPKDPNNQTLQHQFKTFIDSNNTIKEEIKNLKFNVKSIDDATKNAKGLIAILTRVVSIVEFFDLELFTKENKKIASSNKLDLALTVANEIIKLPFFLSFFSNPFLRIAISIMVQCLNTYQKTWRSELAFSMNDEIFESDFLA